MVIRPHDLIELSDITALSFTEVEDEGLEWVKDSLRQAPFVVVRRAPFSGSGHIPVGIRGDQRSQRMGAYLSPAGAARIITPYDIARQQLWNNVSEHRRSLPVIRVMQEIAKVLSGCRWGPAGSGGFEMATGAPVLKESSDLDLVIDMSSVQEGRAQAEWASRLLRRLDRLPVRTDIQLETPEGAYLLHELVKSRTGKVLLRTARGPELVPHPWKLGEA